jgi:hypothetical protein
VANYGAGRSTASYAAGPGAHGAIRVSAPAYPARGRPGPPRLRRGFPRPCLSGHLPTRVAAERQSGSETGRCPTPRVRLGPRHARGSRANAAPRASRCPTPACSWLPATIIGGWSESRPRLGQLRPGGHAEPAAWRFGLPVGARPPSRPFAAGFERPLLRFAQGTRNLKMPAWSGSTPRENHDQHP